MKFSHSLRNLVFFGLIILVFVSSLVSSSQTAQAQDEGPEEGQPTFTPTFPPEPTEQSPEPGERNPLEPYLSEDGKTAFFPSSTTVFVIDTNPENQIHQFPAVKGLRKTATFEVDYVASGTDDYNGKNCLDFPADARTAIEYAASIWSSQVNSTVPITILACWSDELAANNLGYSGNQPFHHDFSDEVDDDVWFMGALANAIAGSDLAPNDYDIYITLNSTFSWYTGTDAKPGTDYDLVTTAAHEIAHGLGFTGSATTYESGGIHYGEINYEQDGFSLPKSYDTFMEDVDEKSILDYDNPSIELYDLLTTFYELHWNGEHALEVTSGLDILMYSPKDWVQGSSYSHLDYDMFNNTIEDLMVHAIGAGESNHVVGPIVKGILLDVGWAKMKPPAPALISPESTIYTRTPTYKWSPVTDASKYQFQLYTGSDKKLDKTVGCTTNPCMYKPSDFTLDYRIYKWRMKSYVFGKWSDYGAYKQFTVAVQPPTALTPNDSSSQRKPTYTWKGVSGATDYEVKVFKGTTQLMDKVFRASAVCSGTSCKTTPDTLLSYGKLNWQVRAEKDAVWSAYSPLVYFSVIVPPPTISKPSGNIYVKRPTFTWTPYQYASDYRLQVFQGSTIKIDKTLAKTVCTTTLCSYTPTSDLAYADYTWKARTKAEGVWSEEWSATKSFKVNGPPTPQLPSGNTYDNTPTYKWTAVSGSDKYRLEVYRGTAFVKEYLINGTYCSAGICTYTPASPKLNYAAHTWKVQAWGNNAWQAYSASKAFTVINPVPDTRGPNGKIYGLSPTYKWGSVTGASKYRFQVYKGTTLVYEKTALSSACTGGECKSTPTEVLTNGVEHKWRVQSYAGGAWQTYSAYAVFTPYSQIPVLLTPSGYTYILNPTYTFTEVLYAMGYQVEITDGLNNVTTYTVWPSSCSAGICSMASPYDLYYYYDYKWRVRAKISDVWKDWSSYTAFYSRDPVARIYGPKGSTYDDTPNLVWTTVEGATQYKVEMVNRDTSTSSVLTITSPVCAEGFCRADWTPALAHNYKLYKFRIAAYGGGSWQVYSDYQNFEFIPLVSGLTTLLSIDSFGIQLDSASQGPSVSADGRRIAYVYNYLDTYDSTWMVYLFDMDTNTTKTISEPLWGRIGQHAGSPALSGDGRYISFTSASDRMVENDTNGFQDVFFQDTETDVRELISVDSNEVQANADSYGRSISGDGRYVIFYSIANNLVTGDTNGVSDVFIRDTVAGTTTRVSVSSSGGQANGGSYLGGISPDGNLVVFSSSANNLVSGDANGKSDIFVRNLSTGVTNLVSLASDGITQGDGQSYFPSISDDGRYVTFSSDAENFGSGNDGHEGDIFLKDTVSGTLICITPPRTGIAWRHGDSKVSGDGSTVVFYTAANNLIGTGNDTNNTWDVFAYNVVTHAITRVSVSSSGAQGNDGSEGFDISNDGMYIFFSSSASNLVLNDTNGTLDIFLHIQ